MAVRDWGSTARWLIVRRGGAWFMDPPRDCREELRGDWFANYSSAHAAYLDAVTCPQVTPFANYSESRCTRARGHNGACKFPSLDPDRSALRVNPR